MRRLPSLDLMQGPDDGLAPRGEREFSMFRWKHGLRLILTVVALFIGGLVPADVVCRRASIQGFDKEYARAKEVLGTTTTSDLSSCHGLRRQRIAGIWT